MRKIIAASALSLLLPSCASSMLSISAKDQSGAALTGFPLRVDFGPGIDRKLGIVPADSGLSQQIVQLSDASYMVTTNSSGEVHIPYDFADRQPNGLLLFLGAEELPSRMIDITPMKTLPKGSKITLSVPNP